MGRGQDRGKSAGNLEQDDEFCRRVALEKRLEEGLSRAGSLSQKSFPEGMAWCSLQTKTVCLHLWRPRLLGFGVGHLLLLCFGKSIPLFFSGQTPLCKTMAILAGAGGMVIKGIGPALTCLAHGTYVLVCPCTRMLFAFLSNLNLCNFRRCD